MLLAMAVYDTEENGRTWMTEATLRSLEECVDLTKHHLFISDNGSCKDTRKLYKNVSAHVIFNGENIGTANAINEAWKERRPGEHAVKMDNDFVCHQPGWVDWIEDAFSRDPLLGILGLKRKDLDENPFDGTSELMMLPHEKGQRWITVEKVNHVIGTCQGYSSALLDKIGYLTQPGLYGFDDSLSAVRARVAGFYCAFLCGFEIDHIDPGGSDFSRWKREHAGEYFVAYKQAAAAYEMGIQDVYHDIVPHREVIPWIS